MRKVSSLEAFFLAQISSVAWLGSFLLDVYLKKMSWLISGHYHDFGNRVLKAIPNAFSGRSYMAT